MPRYRVTVVRKGFRQIGLEVDGQCEDDARNIAEDVARSGDMPPEHHYEYTAETVELVE